MSRALTTSGPSPKALNVWAWVPSERPEVTVSYTTPLQRDRKSLCAGHLRDWSSGFLFGVEEVYLMAT